MFYFFSYKNIRRGKSKFNRIGNWMDESENIRLDGKIGSGCECVAMAKTILVLLL